MADNLQRFSSIIWFQVTELIERSHEPLAEGYSSYVAFVRIGRLGFGIFSLIGRIGRRPAI